MSSATLNTLQTNEAENGAEKIERREKRNIEHDTASDDVHVQYVYKYIVSIIRF